MNRLRSQMISVRELLRKMRTHAVVSVIAAVALVTALCGFCISAGIRHLRSMKQEQIFEGDRILVSVTETVEAPAVLNETIVEQLETMRMSLTELHDKIDTSSVAVTSIEDYMHTIDRQDMGRIAEWSIAVRNLETLKTEITNAFDKIDSLMMLLALYGEQDETHREELMVQMQDITLTMNWITEAYTDVSTKIAELVQDIRVYREADLTEILAHLEALDKDAFGDLADIQRICEHLAESIDMSAIEQGVASANDKLDLLLARMDALEKGQGESPDIVQDTLPAGDAESRHVLSGKTYINADGALSVGTMPDHSDIGNVITLSGDRTTITFEEGYYPGFTVNAPISDPGAGNLMVSHHVHATTGTSETVVTSDLTPTADGPADDAVSKVKGGCFTEETGHKHDASCYTTKTVKVPKNVCNGTQAWDGPFGPDSSGKQYWVGGCTSCGVTFGSSYSGPGSSSSPSHSAGATSLQYTTEKKSVVSCGLTEETVYKISCGHTRGEVMSYTVSFE